MPIVRLPDEYLCKENETKTKDDLLLAYAASRHGRDVSVGFQLEGQRAVWVIQEPADWPYIVREFNALRHIFEPFSLEVARRRSAVRDNAGKIWPGGTIV